MESWRCFPAYPALNTRGIWSLSCRSGDTYSLRRLSQISGKPAGVQWLLGHLENGNA